MMLKTRAGHDSIALAPSITVAASPRWSHLAASGGNRATTITFSALEIATMGHMRVAGSPVNAQQDVTTPATGASTTTEPGASSLGA
jgi:hypothetical protein